MSITEMTESRPYSAYKPSGVEWLGDVPAHWELRRMKTLAKATIGLTYSPNDVVESEHGTLVLRASNIFDRKVVDADNVYVRCLVPEKLIVRNGDILICSRSGSIKLIGKNARIDFKSEGATFGAFMTILRGPNNDYLHQVLNSKLFEYQSGLFMTSTINQLTLGMLNNMHIPLPPYEEQAAIVRYLDQAYQQIQACISAKQRLIALLQEQQQAIIQQAVTRGLDPNVKLKPSGVEWLGAVPEHWEVRRIKSLSLVKRGASPRPIDDPKFFEENGEYAWVRISDVTASNKYLRTTSQRMSELGQSLSVPLQPGSLFLSIAGSVGKPIITKIKCCIHDGFVYFPTFTGATEFLYQILSIGGPFAGLGKLGTQLNLNTETVGNICIGWPPAEEQYEITQRINEASISLEDAISLAGRQIELMEEYRTRLIADVVTGKLDVREAAEDLPQLEPTDITN